MDYKPYSNYKDSNVSWMGEIPNNWSIRKLKFLSQNLDNKRIPISAEDRVNGDYPYYGATGIVDYINNYIFDEKLLLVGEDGAPFFDKNKDVSFLISGKSWVNNHAHVLRINEGIVLAELVMHSLNCTDYSLYIKGSTRDKLNQDQLKNIPIIISPIEEQQQIVEYLDKKTNEIDETISKNKQLIDLLEEKRIVLINQTVTKGLNPDIPMKDSEMKWIGEIPEHWDTNRGKTLLTQLKRNVKSDDEVITCFRDGEVTLRSKRRETGFTMSDKEIGYQGIEVNDLVVHGMDGFAGAIGISDSRGKGSPVLIVLDSKQNKKYLMYYLRNLAYNNIFLALSTGIRVRSCDLRWEKLANLTYLIPPLNEQEQIVNFLDNEINNINNQIKLTKKFINLLEEKKSSLIHHVITGKINVTGEVCGGVNEL